MERETEREITRDGERWSVDGERWSVDGGEVYGVVCVCVFS